MKNMIKKILALIAISLLAGGQAHAAATVTYYHHDALGSVIASSHEDGWINWNEEYQPYGEKIYDTVDTEGGSDEFYTGKNYDRELDITYFGARWYDAKQGRFLSMDPVGVSLTSIHSFNRYVYANNNPYKFVDPDGREPHTWADGNYSDFEGDAQVTWQESIDAAYAQVGEGIATHWDKSPAIIVGTGIAGLTIRGASSWLKSLVTKKAGPKVGSAGGPGAGKAFPKKVQDAAREESNNTCVFCGVETKRTAGPHPQRSNIDHAIPKSRNGNNTPENAQNTCQTCNFDKRAQTTQEYLNR